MHKRLAVTIAIALSFYGRAHAEMLTRECSNTGGDVLACFESARSAPRQCVSGHHGSADVMRLRNASGVTQDSTWLFHSARDANGFRSSAGNTVILAAVERRYPRLAEFLAHDVFGPLAEVEFSGAELHARFGVKICGEE